MARRLSTTRRNVWLRKRYTTEVGRTKNRTVAARFTNGRARAKKYGRAWLISRLEFALLIGQPCAYCGGRLEETGTGLDRMDCALGYTMSNVIPCCWACNNAKGDRFTVDEMRQEIGPAIRKVMDQRKKALSPALPLG